MHPFVENTDMKSQSTSISVNTISHPLVGINLLRSPFSAILALLVVPPIIFRQKIIS